MTSTPSIGVPGINSSSRSLSQHNSNVGENSELGTNKAHHLINNFLEITDIPPAPLSPLVPSRPQLPEPKTIMDIPPTILFTQESFHEYSVSRTWFEKELKKHQTQTSTAKLAQENEDFESTLLSSPTSSVDLSTVSHLDSVSDTTMQECVSSFQQPIPELRKNVENPSLTQISSVPAQPIETTTQVVNKSTSTSIHQLEDQALQTSQTTDMQRFSALTEAEHAIYLDLVQKLAQQKTKPGVSIMTPDMMSKYQRLHSLVIKEIEEYRKFGYNKALERKEVYFKIHPEIQKKLENIFEKQRKRVLEYDQYYDAHLAFDIRSVHVLANDPVLRHKATVLQIGRVLAFQRPSVAEIPLSVDYFPVHPCLNPTLPDGRPRWQKKEMPSLASDPNIADLVSKHKIDVVMTSSVLVSLIDHMNAWEIPVKVVEQTRTENQGQKISKIVMLEKPLINKRMTPRQMNNRFYDVAFKTLSLQPHSNHTCINFDTKPFFQQPISQEQQLLKHPQSESQQSFVENNSVSSSETSNQRSKSTSTAQSNDSSISEGNSHRIRAVANNLGLEDDNLTYNLWRFGDMTLLIRCKIHGMILDQKSPQGFRYVGITTKMEYQPSQGCEQVTLSETARWWAYTYIRPDAHLMLGHINVLDNVLLEVDHRDMLSILPPDCLFRPERASKVLFVTLEKLCNLQNGSYLLCHKSNEPNIVVYKSVSGSNFQYDLHQAHKFSPTVDTDTFPYVPIRWTSNYPKQIPETFPINKFLKPQTFGKEYCSNYMKHGVCKEIGCRLIHSKPPKLKKYKQVHFCHSFARTGSCNHGPTCPYPHLTADEVIKKANEITKGKRKEKRKKKKKQKFTSMDQSSTSEVALTLLPHLTDWDAQQDAANLNIIEDDFSVQLKQHLTQHHKL